MRQPRSIRNNNPLNIDANPNNKWVGILPYDERNSEQREEKRFEVFRSQVYGFRAAALLLQTYQDRYGLRTIRELVNRWAPPVDVSHVDGSTQDQPTTAYVHAVADRAGVGPDHTVDVTDFDTAFKILEAMAQHETGRDPRTGKPWKFDPAVIEEGLRRAGVTRKKPSGAGQVVANSDVAVPAAAGIAVAVEAAESVAEAVKGAEQHILSGDTLQIAFGVLLAASAIWVAYSRYRKNKLEAE